MNLYIRYIFSVEFLLKIKFILSYFFIEKIFYYTPCYCKGQIENEKSFTSKVYLTFEFVYIISPSRTLKLYLCFDLLDLNKFKKYFLNKLVKALCLTRIQFKLFILPISRKNNCYFNLRIHIVSL